MNLSIIIPAYNEAERIADNVAKIEAFCKSNLDEWEIIVVDDGSRDGTANQLRERPQVICLKNETNQGKGFSVRRGVLAAAFDPILFSDADLSAPISEATRLLYAIEDGADVAIGSRGFDVTTTVERRPLRNLMALAFRIFVKVLTVRGFYDTQCGFKMFRKSAAGKIFRNQRLTGWGFDVELLYIAHRKRLRVDEVSVSWKEADESRLKWHKPLTMAWDLGKIRWNGLIGRYDRCND